MRARTWRPGPAGRGPSPGRFRIPWARLLLVAVVAAAVALFAVPAATTISADGLVYGDLVPVAPLNRARIDQLAVACNDPVRSGQRLAVVSNFLIQANFSQQAQHFADQASLERVAAEQGADQAATGIVDADAKVRAADAVVQKQRAIYEGFRRAYADGATGKADLETSRLELAQAGAEADAARSIAQEAREHAGRVSADSREKQRVYQGEADQYNGLANKVQTETLHSPVSGNIVQCLARPGQVMDAGAPLFRVFGTDRAYVLGYFDPDDSAKLRAGDTVEARVHGIDRPLEGTVTTLYPTLARLPEELTRFFWQKQQWNEYRPVKIVFRHLDPALRSQLSYNARVTIAIRRPGAFAWMHRSS